MKKVTLFATLLLLGSFVTANAGMIPMTWTDTYDPADIRLSSSRYATHSIGWDFDITQDGYNPATDAIWNYGISLGVTDDNGGDWKAEWAYFDQAGLTGDSLFEIDFSDVNIGASFSGWVDLSLDGIMSVSLTALSGDFIFQDATLTAKGISAPEPALMGLFGAGLIGLGFARRLRKA